MSFSPSEDRSASEVAGAQPPSPLSNQEEQRLIAERVELLMRATEREICAALQFFSVGYHPRIFFLLQRFLEGSSHRKSQLQDAFGHGRDYRSDLLAPGTAYRVNCPAGEKVHPGAAYWHFRVANTEHLYVQSDPGQWGSLEDDVFQLFSDQVQLRHEPVPLHICGLHKNLLAIARTLPEAGLAFVLRAVAYQYFGTEIEKLAKTIRVLPVIILDHIHTLNQEVLKKLGLEIFVRHGIAVLGFSYSPHSIFIFDNSETRAKFFSQDEDASHLFAADEDSGDDSSPNGADSAASVELPKTVLNLVLMHQASFEDAEYRGPRNIVFLVAQELAKEFDRDSGALSRADLANNIGVDVSKINNAVSHRIHTGFLRLGFDYSYFNLRKTYQLFAVASDSPYKRGVMRSAQNKQDAGESSVAADKDTVFSPEEDGAISVLEFFRVHQNIFSSNALVFQIAEVLAEDYEDNHDAGDWPGLDREEIAELLEISMDDIPHVIWKQLREILSQLSFRLEHDRIDKMYKLARI